MEESNGRPVLHIFLVNFHHKRGSQIEFVYPPIKYAGQVTENVPSSWKNLPTFCLPDGAHNVSKDTVFFTLPELLNPKKSVYGVSCYRQIAVEDLKVVTEDVTRSSVQKSVCAVLQLPLFGYIEVKLSLVADVFFMDQNTDILIKTYNQLNQCLLNGGIDSPLQHLYVGLNIREIFLKWRHKLLILFKLFLLQKRVIFFGSPVRPTCELIVSIASLFPELMTKGFDEVFCVKTSRSISPIQLSSVAPNNDSLKVVHDIETNPNCITSINTCITEDDSSKVRTNNIIATPQLLQRDTSLNTLYSTLSPFYVIESKHWSAPIPIFQNGHLFCPYLSLPFMDLLQDPSVQSYVIGASNILFKQKRQLADVFVETESGRIELNDTNVGDLELRKLLELSTEDRRFIDYLLKHVQSPKEGAEGSENWIRQQFYLYTVALLRTSLCTGGSKELDQFNGHFMTIFRRTDAYDDWSSARTDSEEFFKLQPGHPFAGTLSVIDMKLRIAQSMHNSESGRKLNQAVNQTIATAKSTFSSIWNSISTTTSGSLNQEDCKTSEEVPKRGRIESCVEALAENNEEVNAINARISNDGDEVEQPRQRKESTKEELEEIIQKTADKIIEYADFDKGKGKGKVFTV
ncbi:late secretory pathway protein AVL9 homolog [Culicoides brevitarsis]|uniref:late secretory pathway protein AVL9 homolog n=1 Tax=Culicoides brevitarsis TaxID=469753 RepID=UPI00307C2680